MCVHERMKLAHRGFGCAHNVRSMTAKRSRKRVASVLEYIASKPKESRASLEAVRRAILKALPNAQEGLAYQMPAYTLNGVGVLYFAGWKSHYSLYPASDALVEAFAKEHRSRGSEAGPETWSHPDRCGKKHTGYRRRQDDRSFCYAVARDGRFLITVDGQTSALPITLLMNWRP